MNQTQKDTLFTVVALLSQRICTQTEIAYLERVKEKAPNIYAKALPLANRVKKQVAEYLRQTRTETIADETECQDPAPKLWD